MSFLTAALRALLANHGEPGEDILESAKLTDSSLLATGHPIADFAPRNGDKDRACAVLRRLFSDRSSRPLYGSLAAEVELMNRASCHAPNRRAPNTHRSAEDHMHRQTPTSLVSVLLLALAGCIALPGQSTVIEPDLKTVVEGRVWKVLNRAVHA